MLLIAASLIYGAAALGAEASPSAQTDKALNGGVFTPEMYGAVGDGTTDDAAHIQAALTAAHAKGGGRVILNLQKRYAITPGTISIPNCVSLVTDSEAATAGQQVSLGAGQPAATGMHGGQFVMLPPLMITNSASDPAYVTLNGQDAALVGVSFFDPAQLQTLAAPLDRPFAVRTSSYDCTVRRVEFVNPLKGLAVNGGRSVIEYVTGCPLGIGIAVDRAYDFTHISHCHFVISWVAGTPLEAWQRANGISYQFLDNDDVTAFDVVSYGYFVGLDLSASSISGRGAHGSYGTVIAGKWDGCGYAVRDACTQVQGVTLSVCHFAPVAVKGAANNTICGYYAPVGKTGQTSILGGTFWSTPDANVRIGGGSIILAGSTKFSAVNVHGVLVDGPATVDIFGNHFANAGSGATILVTDPGCHGRIQQNVLESGAPANVSCASAGVALDPAAGASATTSGNGSPEGVLTAVVGSIYTDKTDPNTSGHVLWIKETGTGKTGWVGK